MTYVIRNETYLAHHGVLGMKWGVRRYQNEDGTWKKGVTSTDRLKGNNSNNHDRLKKAAKIAGAAVLTGAALYGAKRLGVGRMVKVSRIPKPGGVASTANAAQKAAVASKTKSKITKTVTKKYDVRDVNLKPDTPISKIGAYAQGVKGGTRKVMAIAGDVDLVDMKDARNIDVYNNGKQCFQHVFDAVGPVGGNNAAEYKGFSRMYVTRTKGDARVYEKFLGAKSEGERWAEKFEMTGKTIKRPSHAEAAKIHDEFLARDDIKKAFNYDHKGRAIDFEAGGKMAKLREKVKKGKITGNESDYQKARAISYHVAKDPEGYVAKEYYKTLREKGYDAVTDYVDANNIGKDPMIIVNQDALRSSGYEKVADKYKKTNKTKRRK